MYPYGLRPYELSPDAHRAMNVIRAFLHSQPLLQWRVRNEQYAHFLGRHPDPTRRVIEALQAPTSPLNICDVLNSPISQTALAALAFEFPAGVYGVVFELLPIAAKSICDERRNRVGVGALMLAGLGLVAYALKKG